MLTNCPSRWPKVRTGHISPSLKPHWSCTTASINFEGALLSKSPTWRHILNLKFAPRASDHTPKDGLSWGQSHPSQEAIGGCTTNREAFIGFINLAISTDCRIDGHNDFPYMIRGWHLGRVADSDVNADEMPIAHTDIKRLRQGCVGGVFWSAYVPWCADLFRILFNTTDANDVVQKPMQTTILRPTLITRACEPLCSRLILFTPL